MSERDEGLVAGIDGQQLYAGNGSVVFTRTTDPMTGKEIMSTIIETLADTSKAARDYVVYTFYCNGGALIEYCGEAGLATRLYARRITAGIKVVNQESSPIREPFHVSMAALLMRDQEEGDDGPVRIIRHQTYSPYFPCGHGEDEKNLEAFVTAWSKEAS